MTRLMNGATRCWQAIARLSSPQGRRSMVGEVSEDAIDNHQHKVSANEAIAEARSVMTALRTVGLYLTKTGFEPGRDFSVGQGKLILNAYAYNYLQQTLEPELWADIVDLVPELLVHDSKSAMMALEVHLGVDFFDNLREAMLVRLPTLSDAAMLGYSSRLIQGICQRHPEIKGFEHWVTQVVYESIDSDTLRDMADRQNHGQLPVQADDDWILLIDLLTAAGGQEDVHFCCTMDGVVATEEGQKLLSQLIARPSREEV
ncbi:MAG: hypothetical protein F6K35_31065 [Okeania sp. SIO2H7]|nr:hypothetical protein [Okeania sp. SIO2H7]